jgi:type IV secretion system protein VirB10
VAAVTEPVKVEKVDPESLVLRAKPRRVIRIKRNLLISAAGAGCVVLVGLAWLGLGSSLIHPAAPSVEEKDPKKYKSGLPDQLAELPKTYADVPQLGAPLPGDLGKPILEHQRLHGMNGTEAMSVATVQPTHPDDSAQTGGLFFPVGAASNSGTSAGHIEQSSITLNQSLMMSARISAIGGPQSEKVTFLAATGSDATINPHTVQMPAAPDIVIAGTVISAALVTGLNSDLPGVVMAQITADVSDSLTGRNVLIPQGTRLIGKYDSTVSFGQSRVLVVWQRMIWPDGRSLEIDNLPASGLDGFAGLKDEVSFHTISLLQGIGLSTLPGLDGELGKDSDDNLVNAIREATQETANQAGQKIVSRQLAVQPTLTVRPGWPLRVIVQKDLIISLGASGDSDD